MSKFDEFAIFILSNRRPDNIKTLKGLKNANYTGKYYIIVDDLDPTVDEYKRNYGDKVIVFDKQYYMDLCDSADNFHKERSTTFVRTAIFDKAKELGLTYFMQLDDDYGQFSLRFPDKHETKLYGRKVLNLDEIIIAMLDFLDKSGAMSVCMGQPGDLIGGIGSNLYKHKLLFKGMNSFTCRVDNPFMFKTRLNEDVNTVLLNQQVGKFFLTFYQCVTNQSITQAQDGGMTEAYINDGTYVKSFYSVMCCPSCVKIGLMGNSDFRIHHKINNNKSVPKIIDEKYKKR